MTLEIKKPWARWSNSLKEFGGYFVITNTSKEPDRLVSAASPDAGRILICGIKVVGSAILMRELPKGLAIPGETTITLKPRGYHLLMAGPKEAREKLGSKVPVTLTFEKAGTIDVALTVEAPGPVGEETLLETS